MRTPLLALFAGSLLIGCTVGDPPGGGDDVSESCGDGTVQSGETCDDGNTTAGDGCSAICSTEQSQTPRLDLAIDKQTISTELMTSHMITVQLGAGGGFSGAVNLAATAVDATTNAPLTGWTVTLDKATVTLPENGNGSAIATLTIPSENKGLSAKVQINATSSLGPTQITSTVTVANQVTIPITLNANGQCVYPAAGTINVTVNSMLRFLNKATASNITIHVNANANGVPHQPDPGSAPNAAYERTITGNPGNAFSWYCHAPGPTVNNLLIQAVAP